MSIFLWSRITRRLLYLCCSHLRGFQGWVEKQDEKTQRYVFDGKWVSKKARSRNEKSLPHIPCFRRSQQQPPPQQVGPGASSWLENGYRRTVKHNTGPGKGHILHWLWRTISLCLFLSCIKILNWHQSVASCSRCCVFHMYQPFENMT